MVKKVLPAGTYKDGFITGGDEGDSFKVDLSRIVKLLYGEFGCTTSAVAANRIYTIGIKTATGQRVLPLYKITVAASLSKLIALGTSTPVNTEVDDSIILPPELLLNHDMEFDVSLVDGQLGDSWSLVFKYVEWID